MSRRPPRRPRVVIFDLDGVVYRGLDPVPGAAQLINSLHQRRVRVRYATNNSMASREAYVERLGAMGIPSSVAEIVTSTSATVGYLRHHLPEARRVMGVGSPAMIAELQAAGLEVIPVADVTHPGYQGEPLTDRVDAVVVGLDQAYDYLRVAVAATAVRDGAAFIATNADLRYPTPRGFLPGAGSLVAAIRAASGGVDPIVVGKPEPNMFAEILEDAGVEPAAAVVIGDNPDADILAAHRSGIFSVLILTGVADAATADGLAGDRQPDVVVAGHAELGRLFDEWLS
ncbi:MAG: HAD-IIA family hydrolase [Chloroflexi bacterium]|nr:MAG: HAD-IIA family hydrolase [Chloroflexota bacterium]